MFNASCELTTMARGRGGPGSNLIPLRVVAEHLVDVLSKCLERILQVVLKQPVDGERVPDVTSVHG